MSKNSKIEWTDHTVNFWSGCKKVSAGCKYCYMFRQKHRFQQDATEISRADDRNFYAALKWKEPARIFTCSMSDFFLKEADDWRADAWKVMKDTPQHTWMILTKRVDRIKQCLPEDWNKGYKNVWIGASIENQKQALKRIPLLYEIPCAVRFLSIEPLLGPIDIKPFLNVYLEAKNEFVQPIHWVIIGGESGNDNGPYIYRKCEVEWIREIMAACVEFEVPVFVKQLGTHLSKHLGFAKADRSGTDMDDPAFPLALKQRNYPEP